MTERLRGYWPRVPAQPSWRRAGIGDASLRKHEIGDDGCADIGDVSRCNHDVGCSWHQLVAEEDAGALFHSQLYKPIR